MQKGTDLEKGKQLVEETQRLMELAGKTQFCRLSIYGEMLMGLAKLSSDHGSKLQLMEVSKEMLNNPPSIEHYFGIIRYLMDHEELERVAELLELVEGWS